MSFCSMCRYFKKRDNGYDMCILCINHAGDKDMFKPKEIEEPKHFPVLESKAQFLVTDGEEIEVMTQVLTRKDAENYCSRFGLKLLKWPVGEKFVFEDGELQGGSK